MLSRLAVSAAMSVAVCLLAASAPAAPKRKKPSTQATLEVTSSVAGATVLLDGKKIGETPIKGKNVRPGTSTVTVRKLGHLEFTDRLELKAGEASKVFADLLPFAGVLKVTANVPGAKVAVDGKVVGSAPLEYEVKIGNRVVTVSAPGYNSVTQNVRADPGSTYVLAAKLESGAGSGALALDGATVIPLESVPQGTTGGATGLELPLEPVASGDPEIALEAMPSLELLAPPRVAATDPNALPLEGLTTRVAAEPPWYKRWYTWAIVGAVVVASATTVVVLSGEEEQRDTSLVGDWRPSADGEVGRYTASRP